MNIPYQSKMLHNGLFLVYIDCSGQYYFNIDCNRLPRFLNIDQMSNLILNGQIQ
jgi:hypothetical protein